MRNIFKRNYKKGIVKGLAAILCSAAILSSCENKSPNLASPYTGTYDPLSNFKDDVFLVACDNVTEYQGVVETLRERNNLRQKKYKMTFDSKPNYMKVTLPNKSNQGIKNSYLHIAIKENLNNLLLAMKNKGIKYDGVQMRGHQYLPMEALYNMTQGCTKKNAIYFFGGCNSYDLAQSKSSKKKPAIGGPGRQESARNTFYLIRMIDLIGTNKADTWNELHSELINSDKQFESFYFPKD